MRMLVTSPFPVNTSPINAHRERDRLCSHLSMRPLNDKVRLKMNR